MPDLVELPLPPADLSSRLDMYLALLGFHTKLSSAGLIYKHYGKEIVSELMDLPVGDPDVETVYLATYKNFMEAIDAIDNGEQTIFGSKKISRKCILRPLTMLWQ